MPNTTKPPSGLMSTSPEAASAGAPPAPSARLASVSVPAVRSRTKMRPSSGVSPRRFVDRAVNATRVPDASI